MKRLAWVAVEPAGAAPRRIRLGFLPLLAGGLLLGACGGNPVTVQVALGGDDPSDARPMSRLEVRLLPYDRDAIFDSLEAAHATPQPEVPADLLQLQEQIAQAQTEWQRAEAQWIAVRDSLRRISETMRGLSRAQPQYVVLFRAFQQLEPQEQALQRSSREAFQRFEQLQGTYAAQTEEVRMRRQQWGDEAFADVDRVLAQRIRELGREPLVDTTNASGVVTFRPRTGQWWVHARVPGSYDEYYWNLPVQVQRGEPVELRLNEQNAEVRPRL
jgi:hypothetical protein